MALMSYAATAQNDLFYLANGTAIPGQISEADEMSVKYLQPNEERNVVRRWKRENILAIFNSKGAFMMVSDLSKNPEISKRKLQGFYNSAGFKSDVLIKASPLKVMPVVITYESDEAINYCTENGEAASIGKRELVGVIHKEGKYDALMEVSQAITLLKVASAKIQEILSYGSAVKCVTPPPPPPVKPDTLTEGNKALYREKSLEKVNEFVEYLNIIADNKNARDDRNRAIEQALKLFIPSATMDVSTKENPQVKTYAMREYLMRLSNLPYTKVSVIWNDIRFANNFKKQPDGTYKGRVVATQTFVGTGKNAYYSDITKKSADVRLSSFDLDPDDNQKKWQVLMGNVGIEIE